MATETKIPWCDHTFNPWRGCVKISPGCAHCYAEAWSHRNPAVLGEWGPDGRRVIAAESYWRQPRAWDRAAARAGVRRRVFCASLADVFEDRPELAAPRGRLFTLIDATPNLDWLLLTKRPGTWRKVMRDTVDAMPRRGTAGPFTGPRWNAVDWLQGSEPSGRAFPPNVWLGVSVEDQARANERVPILLDTPAAVRWVSYEPALDAVDWSPWMPGLDWIVVGGESGPKARPFNVEAARDVIGQCRLGGAAPFVKQLGSRPFRFDGRPGDPTRPVALRDPKGGDPAEWPADLRVREFPDRERVASSHHGVTDPCSS
jgi:protein gp37